MHTSLIVNIFFSALLYLEGTPNCVDYHGIGASHSLDTSTTHKNKIPPGSLKFHYGQEAYEADFRSSASDDDNHGAFAHVSVTSEGLTITHISSEGKVLYTAPTLKPRA